MNKPSRRSLARWAVQQLNGGSPINQTAKALAASLINSKMTDQVDFLLEDILYELEHSGRLAYAKVTTGQPLTKQLKTSLKAQIKTATKSDDVILEQSIDKTTLGGIRVETASRVWDQTIARKLSELKEAF